MQESSSASGHGRLVRANGQGLGVRPGVHKTCCRAHASVAISAQEPFLLELVLTRESAKCASLFQSETGDRCLMLGAFMTLFFIILFSFSPFHTAASRAETGGGVAADRQEALLMVTELAEHETYPSGCGKDVEDFLANMRNKKLQRQKQRVPRSVLEGSSANRSSLLEEPDVMCPTPAEAFPGLFDKKSIRLLGERGFGHAYAVQIRGCAATSQRSLVVKTMEIDPYDYAWVEALLAESFKDAEPGLVTSFAHAQQTMKRNSHIKCMFMLMEHADSGELAPRLRNGVLSLREKALIFYESLVGLRTLHK